MAIDTFIKRTMMGLVVSSSVIISPCYAAAVQASGPQAEPTSLRQFSKRPQFDEAVRKAVFESGSTVSEDFIKQWFGSSALEQKKTPLYEFGHKKQFYSVQFVNTDGSWKKIRTDIQESGEVINSSEVDAKVLSGKKEYTLPTKTGRSLVDGKAAPQVSRSQ